MTNEPENTNDHDEEPPIRPERRPRVQRFALRVFLIGSLLHLYIGWRLIPDLGTSAVGMTAAALLLLAVAVLIPVGTLAHAFFHRARTIDVMVLVGGTTLGWFSSLLVMTILRDISLIFVTAEAWPLQSAVGVIIGATLVTAFGFFGARKTARIVDIEVRLDRLPKALDGLTIAQITDVHVGPTIKRDYVRRIVNRVNEIGADLVAITGDVVDGRVSRLMEHARPLADLKARYGSFVVTGNHEYYSGADEWLDAFRDLGLKTLENQHEVVEHNGASLVVGGVHDYKASAVNPDHVSDPALAAAGAPDDAVKILLAHQPRTADAAEAAGFDLQLSGHTHGGQFWPWNHFVRFQQPYVAGLHQHGKMQIYTSRGTGYWGPPKRFGAPSEITRITLRCTAA